MLLSVPTELVEETRQIVVEAMEAVPTGFGVPLKVEIKYGQGVGGLQMRAASTGCRRFCRSWPSAP